MKLAVFDTHSYDREAFEKENAAFGIHFKFFEPRLTVETAKLAAGYSAVCSFVNDTLNAETLEELKKQGVGIIALRSAGYNHVDLQTATKLQIAVTRVPEYSPYAVAEHAVALILSLNRKVHRASMRVRELNFSLDGLVGFDLHKKKVGIIGTGKIGAAFARIMHGFGCECLAHDVQPNPELQRDLKIKYVPLEELLAASDIVSLHVPLTPGTFHMVNSAAIAKMKPGVMFINTSRGGLVDTKALIDGLKSGHVGYAGLDVYEEEANYFFQDLSSSVLQDDVLARLLTFPNVLITSHQGFLTQEALRNIAWTTLESVRQFYAGQALQFAIS